MDSNKVKEDENEEELRKEEEEVVCFMILFLLTDLDLSLCLFEVYFNKI